jgi:hypothetical protein
LGDFSLLASCSSLSRFRNCDLYEREVGGGYIQSDCRIEKGSRENHT